VLVLWDGRRTGGSRVESLDWRIRVVQFLEPTLAWLGATQL
jgi:hypothetical protein